MRLSDISIKKKLVAIFLLGMLVVLAFMLLNIRELRLIGGEADILSRPRQDTMLLAAEVAHLQWASRVQTYLLDNGETTLDASLDGHKCAFGRWFYGSGKAGLERYSSSSVTVCASASSRTFAPMGTVSMGWVWQQSNSASTGKSTSPITS